MLSTLRVGSKMVAVTNLGWDSFILGYSSFTKVVKNKSTLVQIVSI